MEFFICIKNKIVENYILIILLLFIIAISDIIMVLTFNSINKEGNIKSNESVLLEPQDKSSNQMKTIKVDIKGYVKKPNVYEITEGSNVLDLINIAGGLKKGATTENINLSKKLKDEMVVIISKKSEYKKILDENTNIIKENNDVLISTNNVIGVNEQNINDIGSNNVTNSLININNASLDVLLTLPGIGESKAKAIIEYREKEIFKTIEEIKNIPGIGDSIFEKIKDKIIV